MARNHAKTHTSPTAEALGKTFAILFRQLMERVSIVFFISAVELFVHFFVTNGVRQMLYSNGYLGSTTLFVWFCTIIARIAVGATVYHFAFTLVGGNVKVSNLFVCPLFSLCLMLNHTYFVNWWFTDDELYVFFITLTITLVRMVIVFEAWLGQFREEEVIMSNLKVVAGLLFALWSFISTLEHYDAAAAHALSAAGPQLNEWTMAGVIYGLFFFGCMILVYVYFFMKTNDVILNRPQVTWVDFYFLMSRPDHELQVDDGSGDSEYTKETPRSRNKAIGGGCRHAKKAETEPENVFGFY
eukprot:3933472-Rhodomonas_salina.1